MEGLEELPLVGKTLVENPLISRTWNLSGMFEYIQEGLGSHSDGQGTWWDSWRLKQPNSLKSWLEQGRDLHQWHSMANWEVSGETLCGKSEDGKSPSEQDWGKTSQVRLGFIYCLGIYTRSTDVLCYSTWGKHEEHSLDKWIIPYRTKASHKVSAGSQQGIHETSMRRIGVIEQRWNTWGA